MPDSAPSQVHVPSRPLAAFTPTLQPPLVSAKVPEAWRQLQKHTRSLAAQGLTLIGGLQMTTDPGCAGIRSLSTLGPGETVGGDYPSIG